MPLPGQFDTTPPASNFTNDPSQIPGLGQTQYLNPDGTITNTPEAGTTIAQLSTPSTIGSGGAAAGNSTGSSPVSSPTTAAGSNSGTGTGTGTGASLFPITMPGLGFISEAFITFETILTDIMQPSFWFRIGAFLAGIPLLIIGLWCLMKAADNAPLTPSAMPIPIPL